MLERYGKDMSLCPKCEKGKLILVAIIYPKAVSMTIGKAKDVVLHDHENTIALHNKATP